MANASGLSGDAALLLTRSSVNECAVVAINYSNQVQPVSAATACANAAFNVVFGGSGTLTADGSGTVAGSVAARAAVVYHVMQ